jgi:hypothetical protein
MNRATTNEGSEQPTRGCRCGVGALDSWSFRVHPSVQPANHTSFLEGKNRRPSFCWSVCVCSAYSIPNRCEYRSVAHQPTRARTGGSAVAASVSPRVRDETQPFEQHGLLVFDDCLEARARSRCVCVCWVRPVLLERQKERKGSPRKNLARKLAGKIAVARDFPPPASVSGNFQQKMSAE